MTLPSFNVGGHTANVNAQLITFSKDLTQIATGGAPGSKTLYVDGQRTDVISTPVGSVQLPFATIMDAVNQIIANGDNSATVPYKIVISAGTYLETIDLSNSALVALFFEGEGVIVGGNTMTTPVLQAINNDNLTNVFFFNMIFMLNGSASHGIEFSSATSGTSLGFHGIIFRQCGIQDSSEDVYFNNVSFIQFDDTGITANINVTNVNTVQFVNGNGPNPGTPFTITTNTGTPTPRGWNGFSGAQFIGCGAGAIVCDALSQVAVESCVVSGDITTASPNVMILGNSFLIGNVTVSAGGTLGIINCLVSQPNAPLPATTVTVNGTCLNILSYITQTAITVNSGGVFVEAGGIHDDGQLTIEFGGGYTTEGNMGLGSVSLTEHLNSTQGNPDVTGVQTIIDGTETSFTFENAFTSAPTVIITPQGDTTAIGAWWVTSSPTGFSIFMKTSGTMTFGYAVFGNPN